MVFTEKTSEHRSVWVLCDLGIVFAMIVALLFGVDVKWIVLAHLGLDLVFGLIKAAALFVVELLTPRTS